MMAVVKARLFYGLPFVMSALLALGCANGLAPIDMSRAFQVFPLGAVGISNAPLKFPKPLVTVRQPFPTLAVGQFAVRWDHYILRDRYVLHEIVGRNPDGSYIMQGANRSTNPWPDHFPLTPANYVGIAYPLTYTAP